jgi:hypothetical protein
MLRINWQEQPLEVGRLVIHRDQGDSYIRKLIELAARLQIEVADEHSNPSPGDFWVGCHPRAGWGDADPNLIGWASVVEVPLAVGILSLKSASARID